MSNGRPTIVSTQAICRLRRISPVRPRTALEPVGCVIVIGDHVHIEVIRGPHHTACERAVQQFVEPAAATGARHQLRRFLGAGERQQSLSR